MVGKLHKIAAITSGLAAMVTGCAPPKKGPETAPKQIEQLLASVVDHEGQTVTPKALLGHWSVLWFYPKAQTSG